MRSESIAELCKALCKAQSQMKPAKKSGFNEYFNSHYSTLQDVWEACSGPLAANGLSVCQPLNGDLLSTILIHESGEWIEGSVTLKPAKPDPQSMVACITYMRRASLAAITGVVCEDDDGNIAAGKKDAQGPTPMRKPVEAAMNRILTQTKPNPVQFEGVKNYEVKFGKFKGLKLGQIPPKDLVAYMNYLDDKASAEGKPHIGSVKEFCEKVSSLIESEMNSGMDQIPF